jgi:hypothetical protein
MKPGMTRWILLGAGGTVTVVVAVAALVLFVKSRSGYEPALHARAQIRQGLPFSEVTRLVAGARMSYFSGDVPQCQQVPHAEAAACRTLTIVFGESATYRLDVSFDAQARVMSVSPLEYED